MKREFEDYVADIVDAIEKIDEFTEDMNFHDFENDYKTVFAVIRALEVIGEAVKNIPNTAKEEYRRIPWGNIAGMRDKLIHEYFGVNIKVVWKTVKEDIPTIKSLFKEMLEKITDE